MTSEAIIAILGSVGGVLTIITGFLLKLHIQRSNCSVGKNCCVFDCVVDDEVEVIKHIRESKIDFDELKNLINNKNLQEIENLMIEKDNLYDKLNKDNINIV